MNAFHPFLSHTVKKKFDQYPSSIRIKMLHLREIIYKTAETTPGVGFLEETLKWGEPSYLPTQTKSGSTIRIDWKNKTPEYYYIYFNCKTTLVDTFRGIYGSDLEFRGNRSIVLLKDKETPVSAISDCIAMALTYHLIKKGH